MLNDAENNNFPQYHFIKWMFADQQKRRYVMKAILVTDQAAGMAGMKLAERPLSSQNGFRSMLEKLAFQIVFKAGEIFFYIWKQFNQFMFLQAYA